MNASLDYKSLILIPFYRQAEHEESLKKEGLDADSRKASNSSFEEIHVPDIPSS